MDHVHLDGSHLGHHEDPSFVLASAYKPCKASMYSYMGTFAQTPGYETQRGQYTPRLDGIPCLFLQVLSES